MTCQTTKTQLSSMLLNPVKSKQQKEIIKDEILQHNKIRWPERGQIPVSEFKVEFLATMAFPTLFPDSKGDPTNSGTKRDITFCEKIKHLIKFGEKKDEKWHYRFAHTLDLLIGHLTCFRDIQCLAKEVYFSSKIQENLTCL